MIEGGEHLADFEQLYREHYGLVYHMLLSLSRDGSLAEELTQETFFRAYINMARLRQDAAAAVWLCRIARNQYFQWCREQKRLLPLEEAIPAAESLEEQTEVKVLSKQALQLWKELEEPYRQVFSLHIFAELPLKEISRIYEKSESWARVTFYRAKQRIMERME